MEQMRKNYKMWGVIVAGAATLLLYWVWFSKEPSTDLGQIAENGGYSSTQDAMEGTRSETLPERVLQDEDDTPTVPAPRGSSGYDMTSVKGRQSYSHELLKWSPERIWNVTGHFEPLFPIPG
jgi:hypothetical protein